MFKNLTKILTADCEVIKFDDEQFFYPIFKNGRSSLKTYAENNNLLSFKNKEISNLKKIIVFLRPPKERFVSGVYTFFYFTNNQVIDSSTLKKIESFDIVDRHFVPQYTWLFHLCKYFQGSIEIKSVSALYNLIPERDGPWCNGPPWKPLTKEKKLKILSIDYKKYIDVDKKIIKKYMNQTVKLKELIKEFKNDLS
jgi:hypothetical protein